MDDYTLDDMAADFPADKPGGPLAPLMSRAGDQGGVVRFSTEDWDGRARTAESAADLLQDAIDKLDAGLRNNYFGECAEGQQMYSKVKFGIANWRSDLVSQKAELKQLAIECRRAGRSLDGTDGDASRDLRT
ncbi:hypothetical protein [Gordonia sp. NPDC003422]